MLRTARLGISLDIVAALSADGAFLDWNGLDFAMQVYQKPAFSVLQWWVRMAEQDNRQLMVRLTKGAYWNMGIKLRQEKDMAGQGLTLGVHNCIGSFHGYVFRRARAGNTYIHCNALGEAIGE